MPTTHIPLSHTISSIHVLYYYRRGSSRIQICAQLLSHPSHPSSITQLLVPPPPPELNKQLLLIPTLLGVLLFMAYFKVSFPIPDFPRWPSHIMHVRWKYQHASQNSKDVPSCPFLAYVVKYINYISNLATVLFNLSSNKQTCHCHWLNKYTKSY